MSQTLSFKFSEPKSLPVILLLDTSGSMATNGNIDVLNFAVRDMLQDFASQDTGNAVIKVAVYTFGPDAKQVMPLMPAKEAAEKYTDLPASGMTPLGGALNLVKNGVIEDKTVISSRDYRPMVVLVSDGAPNDDWRTALKSFTEEGRTSKCFRVAMGIGSLPPEARCMLEKFVSDKELVFTANDSKDIKKFFKFVSMSTISRSVSSNPNKVDGIVSVAQVYDDLDDDMPF